MGAPSADDHRRSLSGDGEGGPAHDALLGDRASHRARIALRAGRGSVTHQLKLQNTSYKEFKIVTYYDDLQGHRLVSVTRGDHEVAGRLMRRGGGRGGVDRADDKVAVVDGADWIKNQMTKQSLSLDDIGLDFYHLADYAHKTKRAVYGEEDPDDKTAPGNVWVAGILHTAKHQGYQALRDALVGWKATLHGPKERQAAEALIGYVTDRRAMIKYPECQAVGRQIGSGPTESMCKATTLRIKGVGMRWDGDNAEAIMALEALEQSGAWQSYWDSRLGLAA